MILGIVESSKAIGNPELLNDPTLAQGTTYWVVGVGQASISGGICYVNTTASYAWPLRQLSVPITAGQTYIVEVEVSSYTAGRISPILGNVSNGYVTSAGTHQFTITPTLTNGNLYIGTSNSTNNVYEITRVSLKLQ